ncbi:MAG TPA: precorrin-6y C5,15-methyltransferase (decarboxylating) subunit CbiE [Patescibacteria group bacterium]|nr:precorrin-6y C5,15-methyltransferase (decarboxylating) subunit CbiE [Patescibacteria group bacterium]
MEHRIIVVGIGPGSPDYLPPVATRAINNARVLVGSRRALESLAPPAVAKTRVIDKDIAGVLDFVGQEAPAGGVVVMVSGDPGFHSLLVAMRQRFSPEQLHVIPGISSVQLAFAREGQVWQDAILLSMHGREAGDGTLDYVPGKKLGILTDGKNNPGCIAGQLLAQGWPPTAKVSLCRDLSYDHEKIGRALLSEAGELSGFDYCVMVVTDGDD